MSYTWILVQTQNNLIHGATARFTVPSSGNQGQPPPPTKAKKSGGCRCPSLAPRVWSSFLSICIESIGPFPFPIFVSFFLCFHFFRVPLLFLSALIYSILSLLLRESHRTFAFSEHLLFLGCPPLDPQTLRASLFERHLPVGSGTVL